MLAFLFLGRTHNPQTGEPLQVPENALMAFVVIHPGPLAGVIQFAKANQLGTKGVSYSIDQVPYAVLPVATTPAGMGAMPAGGAPAGQPGQDRPDSAVDPRSHFQELGDVNLTTGEDTMFGESNDGTYSDLIGGGGGFQEVPRPK